MISELPYCLEINSELPSHWVELPNCNPQAAKYDGNILVHFTAGSPDQSVYEAGGGFFTQGFCKAMQMPRTLPDLLATVRWALFERLGHMLMALGWRRSEVRSLMHLHHRNGKLQVPQVRASKLYLDKIVERIVLALFFVPFSTYLLLRVLENICWLWMLRSQELERPKYNEDIWFL